MKFVIVGTGGTGGVLGAYLARNGHDVTFIARNAHLAAIKENGLKLESTRGDFAINPAKACTMEEYNDTPDVILVCVKYYNIDDAIALAKRVAGPETIVLPILNVYGTGGIMQKALPDKVCLDGTIYVVAEITAPGVIKQKADILRVFFGYRKGQQHILEDKCHQVEAVMKEAGIDAHFTDNIERDALQKFAFVSPMGAAGLYHKAASEEFQKEGQVREDFKQLIQEVVNVGAAMGLTFERNLVEVGLKIVDSYGSGVTTSMQRDVWEGKRSEFAGLVDSMAELGKEYGVPVPTYDKVSKWGKEQGIKC